MPSIRTTIFATATTLLSAAHADYVIDPSTVSLSLRSMFPYLFYRPTNNRRL